MRSVIAPALALWSLAFVESAVQAAAKRAPKTDPAAVSYSGEIQPLLSRYCYGCHGEEKKKADLSLAAYQEMAQLRADRKTWEKVVQNIRRREMPPEGRPQPTAVERERLVRWIETELFPCDCEKPDPGRITIRRLNRAEYNNTIRDLVGVAFQPADDFPADDAGYGFDNIGDVLSVSPLLMEKYLGAAAKILEAAVRTDGDRLPSRVYSAPQFQFTGGGALAEDCCFSLFSQGEVFVAHAALGAGQHRVRVRAYGQQAGPEPARMSVSLDGKVVKTFDVSATEEAPGDYELRVQLGAQPHRIAAAFVNDYYEPNHADPARRDRNLLVQTIEVEGPLDGPRPPPPESHRRIFFCHPDAKHGSDCARRIITRFAERAYRRPLIAAETDRLTGLAEQGVREGESFETAVRTALAAVLVSPHFLFRGELQPEPDNPHATHPVNEFALAARLSYFLWSSMPDEGLFALARQGQLRKNLDAEVRRMLGDKKAQALVQNFAGQWLQLRNLKLATPDAKMFPEFDESLRASMEQETEFFFGSILRDDRSVLEFLTADYTYADARLRRHYGLPAAREPGFQRVSLKGTGRGGVLTHGSVLTLTSNPTRTSPVKRGKWVLENLLGEAPPPPPPDVPALSESKEAVANGTLRQRMEQHRQNPNCISCHTVMDPIGFGLENFDGIGAWRTQEGGFPIDAAGRLGEGETFAGPDALRELLVRKKQDAFVRCLTEKMLTYALGRGLEYCDKCAVDQIARNLARGKHRFSTLVLEIVKSVPFQMRRGEGERLALFEKAAPER